MAYVLDFDLCFWKLTEVSFSFLFRSFLAIGKKRSDASTSIRNCRISNAWSQSMTAHKNCPSDWAPPPAGCNMTGPKDSLRTQRLPSWVLELLRHYSLYSSEYHWNQGAWSFFKSWLGPQILEQTLPCNFVVFNDFRCNGWILFCCKGICHTVTQNTWSFLLDYILILPFILSELKKRVDL